MRERGGAKAVSAVENGGGVRGRGVSVSRLSCGAGRFLISFLPSLTHRKNRTGVGLLSGHFHKEQ